MVARASEACLLAAAAMMTCHQGGVGDDNLQHELLAALRFERIIMHAHVLSFAGGAAWCSSRCGNHR